MYDLPEGVIYMRLRACFLMICLLSFFLAGESSYAAVNQLRLRGYSLIPSPQQVQLTGEEVLVDSSWGVRAETEQAEFAEEWLLDWAERLHGYRFGEFQQPSIVLRVAPGTVSDLEDSATSEQAYQLTISSERIEISGNGRAGLLNGVQSLLQLMRRDQRGRLKLPSGIIVDWPDLPLRIVHWDTKHHQNRVETLMRYLDWAAIFKINAVSFEIEDKYEYPSHPVVGAPGAYTKAQLQNLSRYALQRNIQLIPNVQAPAHMTFVLKHEEFAHLRSDGSNYLACMCDEEAMQLIFDLYQDMIDATPGVEYFHVSTDEVYYAGICEKCTDEYNVENRSQLWVDYVNRVHSWMAERNRKMMCWVEYPLLVEHIAQLPTGLIDAITVPGREQAWIDAENRHGILQIAYSSMQGSEHLFPNLFPTEYRGRRTRGRLQDARETVSALKQKGAKNLIGTFCASWDDAGLHDELFWLGWTAVSQYGWTYKGPSVEQTVSDFLDAYYGPGNGDIVDIYRLLEEGARNTEAVWDRRTSTERGAGYGNSRGKGIGTERSDLLLEMPQLPEEGTLRITNSFREKYSAKISAARDRAPQNDVLIQRLTNKMTEVERNRYSLEVMLSIAYFERFVLEAVTGIARVEDYLVRAGEIADSEPSDAVRLMFEGYNLMGRILYAQEEMWQNLTGVWERSRLPKNQTVDGREFVWVLDDVKDHFADRRRGLDYMLAPLQRMDMPGWREQLLVRIQNFAELKGVPIQGLAEERLED